MVNGDIQSKNKWWYIYLAVQMVVILCLLAIAPKDFL